MARTSNFTDSQKAEIFVRDRAICAYTGEKLWILDGGATPSFPVDWADHIHPVAQGGTSTIENGICAGWKSNYEKRDNLTSPPVLFCCGQPTTYYLETHPQVPQDIASYLNRMASLSRSDWFFNRALFRLLLGVDYHAGDRSGKRDDRYYASASFRAIEKWRKLRERENVPALHDRQLTPPNPTPDQMLMLEVAQVDSADAIRQLMKQLLPHYISQEQ